MVKERVKARDRGRARGRAKAKGKGRGKAHPARRERDGRAIGRAPAERMGQSRGRQAQDNSRACRSAIVRRSSNRKGKSIRRSMGRWSNSILKTCRMGWGRGQGNRLTELNKLNR